MLSLESLGRIALGLFIALCIVVSCARQRRRIQRSLPPKKRPDDPEALRHLRSHAQFLRIFLLLVLLIGIIITLTVLTFRAAKE